MSKRARSRKNRVLTYAAGILVVLAGYYFGRNDGGGPPSPAPSAPLPPIANSEFEALEGCRLIHNGGNDGDSFRVIHKGKEHTFRLYFVDTPETSLRYPERVDYQARYFGITRDQAVEIGDESKKFTMDLLEKHPFVVLTRWEKVMKSYRYHGFVLVETAPGKTEYLSEILVRKGFARIYTMPADLPDGTSKKEFDRQLKDLEQKARVAEAGGWRF